jgi:hypothetical protein
LEYIMDTILSGQGIFPTTHAGTRKVVKKEECRRGANQ